MQTTVHGTSVGVIVAGCRREEGPRAPTCCSPGTAVCVVLVSRRRRGRQPQGLKRAVLRRNLPYAVRRAFKKRPLQVLVGRGLKPWSAPAPLSFDGLRSLFEPRTGYVYSLPWRLTV